MRIGKILSFLTGLTVCLPAFAGELEPAIGVRLAFGGDGLQAPHLGLRLDYAEHGIAAGPDSLRLPAAMELAYVGGGRLGLYANGLLLKAGPALRLTQAEETVEAEEESFWQGWGFNTGTVLLAGGAAIAVIVAVAGDEAEDLQDGNPDPTDPDDPDVGPPDLGCVADPTTCLP